MDSRSTDTSVEAGGVEQFNDAAKEQRGSKKWKDRFTKRFRRFFADDENSKEKVEREVPEEIGVVQFIREIFRKDDEEDRHVEKSWIDEAFESRERDQAKIDSMDDHTRTEFHMVVAERFREAGERFISMVGGISAEQDLSADTRSTQDAPARASKLSIEKSPPFDFARAAAVEMDQGVEVSTPTAQVENQPTQRSTSEYSAVEQPEKVERQTQDGVTTYVYRPRLRDVLLGGAVGGAVVANRKGKKLESRIEKQTEARLERQKSSIEERIQEHQRMAVSRESIREKVVVQEAAPSVKNDTLLEAQKRVQELEKKLAVPQSQERDSRQAKPVRAEVGPTEKPQRPAKPEPKTPSFEKPVPRQEVASPAEIAEQLARPTKEHPYREEVRELRLDELKPKASKKPVQAAEAESKKTSSFEKLIEQQNTRVEAANPEVMKARAVGEEKKYANAFTSSRPLVQPFSKDRPAVRSARRASEPKSAPEAKTTMEEMTPVLVIVGLIVLSIIFIALI